MEDDPAEVRIAVVAVRVPVGAAQMDLDVSAEALAVDQDFGAQEVGARAAVPVAWVDDLDCRAGGGGHRTTYFARGPETLDGTFTDGEGAVRAIDLLDAGAGAHARIKGESVPRGKSGESPRVTHRIGLREGPSRR